MKVSLATVIAFFLLAGTGTFAQITPPPNNSRPLIKKDGNQAGVNSLTSSEEKIVKSILSKYNPNSLTATEAKAIHEDFRKTGLRAGPAMDEIMRESGFNPQEIRRLAPPPERNQRDENGPATRPDQPPRSTNRVNGINGQISKNSKPGGDQRYSIEQAISDRAQLTTIAFNGLAFLTGNFAEYTFIPPGKVCDFFGFQYMRDIDIAKKGHNPIFLNRVVGNVMHILTPAQRKLFFNLAETQTKQLQSLALERMPLIMAFNDELNGKNGAVKNQLDRNKVSEYTGKIFRLDAELSYERAKIFGKVALSLTQAQKESLGKMKFGDFNSWPARNERSSIQRGKSRLFNIAYMTYASEFFSWYSGSVKADTYFCPERHGTYFGGFFMKDMPAMNKRDFDISTSITGNLGEEFLDILNSTQRQKMSQIVEAQRKYLLEIIKVRRAISIELRKFLDEKQADKKRILQLGTLYGQLDGKLSWLYATTFSSIKKTLSPTQLGKINKLRVVDNDTVNEAYIYSNPVKKLTQLLNSDYFF